MIAPAINQNLKLLDAIKALENSVYRMVIVIDESGLLKGTITDGDVRRGLLSGMEMNSDLSLCMNKEPHVAKRDTPKVSIIDLMRRGNVLGIPIVDEDNNYLYTEHLNDILREESVDCREDISANFDFAVIMAGGEGKRLLPLTSRVPKPMVEIAGIPLLERQINNLIKFGIEKVYISINYLSHVIEDYFGDGSRFNIQIQYLRENTKLGTAGALSLLNEYNKNHSFLLMNGDVLTNLDLMNFYSFHKRNSASITIAGIYYNVLIPYGVLKTKQHQVVSLREKPSERFLCNAGIYALNCRLLELVPKNSYFDVTELIGMCLNDENNSPSVFAYPLYEDWSDIGTPADLELARERFALAEIFTNKTE